MTVVVAVINQKGGVGKTTTSINLAGGLAKMGYRVLLIDFDPQAHSTIGLAGEEQHPAGIHDVLLKQKEIVEVIVGTPIENLFLAPSHIRLDKAEQQLAPEMFRETRLHNAISRLTHDFIIIDCRPTLGTLTVNALYACNFILVPCEMARFSLEGFSDLMETVDNVRSNSRKLGRNSIRILLTKYDARKSVTNEWVMAQLEPYKGLLFKTVIRQNEALNQANMAMETIYDFKPSSYGAADYLKFSEEFSESCRQLEKN